MVVGILYEGGLDIDPVIEIIKIISNQNNYNPGELVFQKYPASGHTLPKLIPAANKFNQENVVLFIVHTDTDGDVRRRRELEKIIEENQELLINMQVVCLVCHPHFEVLFIEEEVAVKRFFGIPDSDPIPYGDKNPKDRLKLLMQTHLEDESMLKVDVYKLLTENMNYGQLMRRDSNFKDFYEQLSIYFQSVSPQPNLL